MGLYASQTHPVTRSDSLVLGWEEWAALPDLRVPAVKVKVDTGADTSALHAFDVETFGSLTDPQVRFDFHPVPGNDDITITCAARVKARRRVFSSNGDSESRYVICTAIEIGGRAWPIEVTLTNRDSMAYRMLLGRQAITEDAMVKPSLSCVHGQSDYAVYQIRPVATAAPPEPPLRIAILTREPDNYSTRRLIEAAEARGHEAECVNTTRCYMAINAARPEIHCDGKPLPSYDAVIPRIGASVTAYGLAVVRQFEAMNVYVMNESAPIGASRDKLYAHQLLARQGIDMPRTAFARSPQDTKDLLDIAGDVPLVLKLLQSTQGKGVVLAETRKSASSLVEAFRGLGADFLVQEFVTEAAGQDIRCLVVGGKVVAAVRRVAGEVDEFRSNLHCGGRAEKVRLTKDERRMAVKAARAIGLSVAGVDLLRADAGPKVLEVNSSPGLEGVEKATGKDVAGLILDHVAAKAHALVRARQARALPLA